MEYVWTPIIPFTPQNVRKVPNNKGGVYKFYDRFMQCIYTGRASGSIYGDLRHRLQSYYQEDDFREHKTKKKLRSDISYFNWAVISNKRQRRATEKSLKRDFFGRKLKHNWN